MSARIAIDGISITRAEGPIDLCGITEEVSSFEEANALLESWTPTVHGNGTEKCDFRITFADGFGYLGTYPLGKTQADGPVDLAGHVRDMLGLLVLDDPARANFRKWVDPDGRKAAAIREMLDRYEMPSPFPDDAGPAPR